jgi:chromosome segregation ATPase
MPVGSGVEPQAAAFESLQPPWLGSKPPHTQSTRDDLEAVMTEQKLELESAQRQRLARLEERARNQDKVIARLQRELYEARRLIEERKTSPTLVDAIRVPAGVQTTTSSAGKQHDVASLALQLEAAKEALAAEQRNRQETERLSERLAKSFDSYLQEMERRQRAQEQEYRRQEMHLRGELRRCNMAKAHLEEQLELEKESLRAAQQEHRGLRSRVEGTIEDMKARQLQLEEGKRELERNLNKLSDQLEKERTLFQSERERFQQASREAYTMLSESAARSDELEKRLAETQAQMQQLRIEFGSQLQAEVARSAALERDLDRYRQRNRQFEDRIDELLTVNQKQAEERASLRAEIRRLTDELVRVQARSTFAERRLQDLLLDASSPQTEANLLPGDTGDVPTPLSGSIMKKTSPSSVHKLQNIESSLRGISEENAAFRAKVRAYLDKRTPEPRSRSLADDTHTRSQKGTPP